MINMDDVYAETLLQYKKAKYSLMKIEKRNFANESAISDIVPGYSADKLEFGSYDKDNFSVLFIDMRGSTNRAKTIGAEKTFLTMHAYIPAMLIIIKYYKGVVIDIMGDGLMVFFGGKNSGMAKDIAIQKSGLCGRAMLHARNKVVNRILKEDELNYEVDYGIGIDYGDVIVTKIGINGIFDVKAFGDCINTASKYSDGYNRVKVSKRIKNNWPTGEKGKVTFNLDGDGYILDKKD